MLNLGMRVKVDINKKLYPVYFDKKNICVHCGGQGTLKFVDKFGTETRDEVYPFDHIKCTKCGRLYSIMWKKDTDNNVMYPVATDLSIKGEFLNAVDDIINGSATREKRLEF
jgi:hypothetical protein